MVRTYYNDVNYKLFAALVGMDEITKIVDGNKFTICKINMNWNAKNIRLGLRYWLYYTDPTGDTHAKAY